jgi:ribokinase
VSEPVVLVVGSANMDLVVTTGSFPVPGETVFGSSFGMFPGGKGANQAVACSKLGTRTLFLGKMGKDLFGDRLVAGMRRDGVVLDHTQQVNGAATGMALITVNATGQNEIVVISGANMLLGPGDIERNVKPFAHGGVLLVQLEVPLRTVKRAVQQAHQRRMFVILNPAPAAVLPKSLLRLVDFLTPNETELHHLTGKSVAGIDNVKRAARALLDQGVCNVLVTLGKKGCLLVNREVVRLYETYRVKAIDTTAAGDAFNGAFASALASGQSIEQAIPFANAVAALSVTRPGAQSSLPTAKEVQRFVQRARTPSGRNV